MKIANNCELAKSMKNPQAKMTQALPKNAFDISPLSHTAPSTHLPKTKQESMRKRKIL